MKEPTCFSKFIDWLFAPHYNCSKEKHHWAYKLSESGKVYLDESKVPYQLWHCVDCGLRKFDTIKSFTSTCEHCGIISCKYIGYFKTDHWEQERLIEIHNEGCKIF